MTKKSKIDHYTDKEALDFHTQGKSGKIEINSSKPLTTKRDLSLAYSPGVAVPVKEIAKNPEAAYDYTSKGNLVAVISNGSAILGLGNLGALAIKDTQVFLNLYLSVPVWALLFVPGRLVGQSLLSTIR